MIDDRKDISAAQWGTIAAISTALISLYGVVVAALVTGCFGNPEICGFAKTNIYTYSNYDSTNNKHTKVPHIYIYLTLNNDG